MWCSLTVSLPVNTVHLSLLAEIACRHSKTQSHLVGMRNVYIVLVSPTLVYIWRRIKVRMESGSFTILYESKRYKHAILLCSRLTVKQTYKHDFNSHTSALSCKHNKRNSRRRQQLFAHHNTHWHSTQLCMQHMKFRRVIISAYVKSCRTGKKKPRQYIPTNHQGRYDPKTICMLNRILCSSNLHAMLEK